MNLSLHRENFLNPDLFVLLFIIVLIILIIAGIFKASKSLQSSAGSNTTTLYGTTYEMYNQEKRAAIEQIVEQKVKKMEEQENEKPEE